ncbi:RagB/SusD family nutrient uptake outer membrane protein [Pinibacter aurantiacus]|uniref:RagB/SusD family nutrient uptake outer membrane protein n=1 Tax=Pinibacter aurantiacus TaxID=2851599 RepID=A0A9E2SB37_9BACT|nr:RagB/SusD family nutrient uptake outer membrane protein [Pinibacter aurantiacus]MBV4358872.1 RagB/SusD family nutrient uptake outer membrane protein [Pinibacter aurantiacus]
MRRYSHLLIRCFIFMAIVSLTACTKYLDKAPGADVSPTDAFINFTNFQGFTEELYACVPEFTSKTWACDWLLGDEIIHKTGVTWLNEQFDNGDSWSWTTGEWISWLDAPTYNTDPTTGFGKGLWPNSWYAIHKANLGLANLDKLNGTQEEKDLIKGQLLFFRGWFHFELMSYWGGLPYIDTVLASGAKLTLPRLDYQTMAESVAKDLREAADLLPTDWDKTTAGTATLGKNQLRITKIAALGYLGKNYLYAGSPLMNRSSKGSATFNSDYCKKAADAFAELLKLVDNQSTWIKLIDFPHYNNLFYTNGGSFIPGYPEAIFQNPVYSSWFAGCPWGPSSIFAEGNIGGGYTSPNARFVENYGMANGLPITDPASGYDPANPWVNRDPRFYHDIVIDGDQIIKGSAPADKEKYRYANLSNGGYSRDNSSIGRTGYLLRKLTPMTCNNIDNFPNNYLHVSYMRLADVYLMYAEAVLQGYGSATSVGPNYITPEDAVNKIRTRCGTGKVGAQYVADKDKFMGEIIRERAMELGFEEEIRYNDLRRWLLAGDVKYREKTSIDFDRDANGKPINIKERVLITRKFEDKNYWLPLKVSDVNLYPTFNQNPGY